ncbi:ParB/RepB/Spo0J family partition protein [Aureliella helgolandensis]|nr:plasmid partitioning protein RepB C-terminal domain-containing protein [Aureliella helgolandensis]
MIPVAQISVLNPRERGRKKFDQIKSNIAAIGLKKPVTVVAAGIKNDAFAYNLVCGQGRLEAYIALEQQEIPCIIAEGAKEDLMLMSLAENLARRKHSGVELVRELGVLKERGYTAGEIAKKTDLDVTYIRGLLKLLEKGEERLLLAIEKGVLAVSVAVVIATSDDKGVQIALQEAYENNVLRGDALVRAKRIIEQRQNGGKRPRSSVRKTPADGVTSKSLVQTYQDETLRQKMLIRKTKACESRLLMAISAFTELYKDDQFQTLLKAEQLDSMPQLLAERIRQDGTDK